MSIRTLFVLGTRPEAIKLAPVIQCFRDRPELEAQVCVTGQDQALGVFDIDADYDLDLMQRDQDLAQLTSEVLGKMQQVIDDARPGLLMVQGDTNSCFAAALSGFYRRVPVAHVEAGLRTGDQYAPYPEEVNRRLTDTLVQFCFTPTPGARDNLLREGIPQDRIWVTGNTVIDALETIVQRQKAPHERRCLERRFGNDLGLDPGKRTVLLTMHRRESFGAAMESTLRGVRRLVQETPDLQVVYPVHPNPNVRAVVKRVLKDLDRVRLIHPIDYYGLVWLMSHSCLVITDSGGIQEEAPALGKPVLVVREVTERPEGVSAGVARVVGTSAERIFAEARLLLSETATYRTMARPLRIYGDGGASRRIANIVLDHAPRLRRSPDAIGTLAIGSEPGDPLTPRGTRSASPNGRVS
jgi:UDP-N-acetylglucosamine 2-epimerase (non-hydrolysing)